MPWRASVGTAKRWPTGSSRCCWSWSAPAPCDSIRRKRRPSTSPRRGSTPRPGRHSSVWWNACIAMCSAPSPATLAHTTNSARQRNGSPGMSRRPELALVALFALAVAAATVAGLRNALSGAEGGTPSAFLPGPDGAKAVYEVLQHLGRPVERRRTPLYDLTRVRRPPALLVVIDPPDDLTAAELEQVVRYVRSGGEVLAAGDGGGITHCTGWDAHPAFLKGYAGDSQPVQQPVSALELPPVTAVLRPLDSLLAVQGHDSRRRVRRNLDRESGCGGLAVPTEDTLLRTEHGEAVILRLRYPGGGLVTLAADPGYFRNRAWRTTDVPPFMVPLLTPDTRGQGRGRGRAGIVQPDEQRAWLGALELALPTTRARNAVRRLQQAQTQPGGAERVLVAAQALEDVWEELRPQTTRAGS